jgi:predicted Zn finger-like uncharacterized protein
MKVKCPKCGVVYKIDPSAVKKETIKLKCKKCGTVFGVKIPPAEEKIEEKKEVFKPDYIKVLLAHESEDVRKELSEKMKSFGVDVILAEDGVSAIELMESEKPHAAVLEVVLPRIFGYEVCELAKKRETLKDIKIILITSTYDTTRFRREPQELYGADDFIDFPFEVTDLLKKLENLTGLKLLPPPKVEEPPQKVTTPPPKPTTAPPPKPTTPPPPPKPAEVQPPPKPATPPSPPKPAGVQPPPKPATPPSPPKPAPKEEYPPEEKADIERAKRLARVIISEIELYNKQLVERGIKEGNFYELLEKELQEGRKLYEERVPEHIRNKYNFLDETIKQFIEKKKKEMGLM